MGEGGELGIVPRFAEELFARVESTADSKVSNSSMMRSDIDSHDRRAILANVISK